LFNGINTGVNQWLSEKREAQRVPETRQPRNAAPALSQDNLG
jgi:hypothetical protein